jgi:hypothetical protein
MAMFLHYGTHGTKYLYINYVTERRRPWATADVGKRYGYRFHPPLGELGALVIDLIDET